MRSRGWRRTRRRVRLRSRRAPVRARWCSRLVGRTTTSSRRTRRRSAASAPRVRNEDSTRLGSLSTSDARTRSFPGSMCLRSISCSSMAPTDSPIRSWTGGTCPTPQDGRAHVARRRVPARYRGDRRLRASQRGVGARAADQLPHGPHPQAPRRRSAERGGRPGRSRTHELRVSATGTPCRRFRAHAPLLDESGDLDRAKAPRTRASCCFLWRRSPSPARR